MADIQVLENSAIAGDSMRLQRNEELKNSDWTQLTDSQLSDSKKAEWETYRQALRDLPLTANPTLDSDGNLQGVTWPDEPT